MSDEDIPVVGMPQQEFDKLLEYSMSIPTAPKPGFRWKRRVPPIGESPKWYLGEVHDNGVEGQVGIRWSEIEIRK